MQINIEKTDKEETKFMTIVCKAYGNRYWQTYENGKMNIMGENIILVLSKVITFFLIIRLPQ